MDDVSLPEKANVPPHSLDQVILLIYGEKGVGKSSLASKFPNSLLLQFEPGRRNLKIPMLPKPNEPPLDWERLQAYLPLLIDKGVRPIFDTVDRVYDACFQHICRKKNITDPNDLNDYGQTWRLIRDTFENFCNEFLFAGLPPIFISHARFRAIPTKSGSEAEQCIPTCKPAAWEYLRAVADFAWYYGYESRKRVLWVRGNEWIWTGCGLDDVFLQPAKAKYRPNQPLNYIPMGKTPDEAYKNLKASFDNKIEGWFFDDEEAS